MAFCKNHEKCESDNLVIYDEMLSIKTVKTYLESHENVFENIIPLLRYDIDKVLIYIIPTF